MAGYVYDFSQIGVPGRRTAPYLSSDRREERATSASITRCIMTRSESQTLLGAMPYGAAMPVNHTSTG